MGRIINKLFSILVLMWILMFKVGENVIFLKVVVRR